MYVYAYGIADEMMHYYRLELRRSCEPRTSFYFHSVFLFYINLYADFSCGSQQCVFNESCPSCCCDGADARGCETGADVDFFDAVVIAVGNAVMNFAISGHGSGRDSVICVGRQSVPGCVAPKLARQSPLAHPLGRRPCASLLSLPLRLLQILYTHIRDSHSGANVRQEIPRA